MSKKPLFLTGYICLLLCFLLGTAELLSHRGERVSETENRTLQGMPKLSGKALLSGVYMEEFENYLSDAFFFREEAAALTEALMSLFDAAGDEPNGEVDEDRLFAPEPSAPETPEQAPETEADPEERPALPSVSPRKTDPADLSDSVFYYVKTDGSRFVMKTYPADELAAFVDILNSYRSALPEDGTLHFAVPPVTSLYHQMESSKKYTGWGSDLEDVLQPAVDDGVFIYDIPDILTPYIGKERLYPASDHHWLPFSAALVAETMLERQGIPAVKYSDYRYYLSIASNAKPFTAADLRNMNLGADIVPLLEAVSPVEPFFLKNLDEREKGIFLDHSRLGLLYYLGGIHVGPWRLYETGFRTGRNAMVIGDSFELTFMPFLVPYYDTILVTDLRESLYSEKASGAGIREYIEKYDVSDIYMLYSTYSPFCSETTSGNLIKYLG